MIVTNSMSIGQRIKQARKRAGLTQEELGRRIRETRVNVTKYELDLTNIPSKKLAKMAKALRVSTDHLLGVTVESLLRETDRA